MDTSDEQNGHRNLESRVAQLEADVAAIKIDVGVIKANGATKADLVALRFELSAQIVEAQTELSAQISQGQARLSAQVVQVHADLSAQVVQGQAICRRKSRGSVPTWSRLLLTADWQLSYGSQAWWSLLNSFLQSHNLSKKSSDDVVGYTPQRPN